MKDKLTKKEMDADIERVVREAEEFGGLSPAQLQNMRKGMEDLRDLCLSLSTACDELDAFAMGYTIAAHQKPGQDNRPN